MRYVSHIPNHRKLWRMRVMHPVHHRDDFPQAFCLDDAPRIRQLVALGLVAFFQWCSPKGGDGVRTGGDT